MTYETIVTVTQILALLFFVFLFFVVVAYAVWPGNREKFRHAARLPLEPGDAHEQNGKH